MAIVEPQAAEHFMAAGRQRRAQKFAGLAWIGQRLLAADHPDAVLGSGLSHFVRGGAAIASTAAHHELGSHCVLLVK